MSVGDLTTVLVNGHMPRCPPTATPSGRKSMPLVNGAHSTSSALLLRSLHSNSNTAFTGGTGTTTESGIDRGNPVATAAAPLFTSSPSQSPYAALLMDTCEYNRGLSRHRVDRLPFLDLATQISQRPAPWLYRSLCDRSPNSFGVDGTHVVIRYLRHRWRLDNHPGHFHSKRRCPMATADLGSRQPLGLLQSDGNTVSVADPDPLFLSGQSSCSLPPTGVSHHWPPIGRCVDRCASNGDHQKSAGAQKDSLEAIKKPTSASERDDKTGAVMISGGEDSMTSSSLEPVSRRPTPDLEETRVRTQAGDEEHEDGSKSRSRKTSCLLLGEGFQEEFDYDAEEEVEEGDAEGEEDAVVGDDVELEEVGEDLVDEDEGLQEEQDEDPDEDDVEWHQSKSSRGQSGMAYGRRPGGRRRLRGCKAATAGRVKLLPGSDSTSSRRQQCAMQKKQSTTVTTVSRRGMTCSRKTSRQSRSDSRTRSTATASSTGRRGASTGTRSLLTSSSSGQGFRALSQPASGSHRRRGDRAFESTWESQEPGFQPNAAIPSFLLPSESRAGASPSRSILTSGVVIAPPPTAPVTIPPRHFQEVPSRPQSSTTVSLSMNNNSTPSVPNCLLSNWHHPPGPMMAGSDLDSAAPEPQLAANYSPCQQPYQQQQQQNCLSIYNHHQQRHHHPTFAPSSVRPTISHNLLSTSTGSPNAVPPTGYLPYFSGQVTRVSLPAQSEARLRDGGGAPTTALSNMLVSAPDGGVNPPVQSGRPVRDNRSTSGYFPTTTTTTEAGSQSYLETVHGNTYRQLIPPPSPVESCGSQPVASSNVSSVGTDSADAGGSTTVVTFFVCEVCSSRYRSTAGLRYHYHSQHSGYTPKNPISASASRLVVPLGEERAIGGGLRGGRPRRHKPYSDSKSKAKTKEVVTNPEDPSSPSLVAGVGCALSSLPVDPSMPTPTAGSSDTRFPTGATSLGASSARHSGLDELMTEEPIHRFSTTSQDSPFQPTVNRSLPPATAPNSESLFSSPTATAPRVAGAGSYLVPTCGGHNNTSAPGDPSLGQQRQHSTGNTLTGSLPLASMASMLASASGDLATLGHTGSNPHLTTTSGAGSNLDSGEVGGPAAAAAMFCAARRSLQQQLPFRPEVSQGPTGHYYRVPGFASSTITVRQRRHERQCCPDRLGMLPTPPPGSGSIGTRAGPTCVYCLGDDRGSRRTGQSEGLLRCSRCDQWAHFSCLRLPGHVVQAAAHYPWQCIDCKTCWRCGLFDGQHQMVMCASCDRAFHGSCLPAQRRPLDEVTTAAWSCDICLNTTANNTSYYPSPGFGPTRGIPRSGDGGS